MQVVVAVGDCCPASKNVLHSLMLVWYEIRVRVVAVLAVAVAVVLVRVLVVWAGGAGANGVRKG